MRKLVVLLAVSAIALAAGCGNSTSATTNPTLKDVVYAPATGAGGGLVDVYTPDGPPAMHRPAIIAIHGGYWHAGDKTDVAPIARELATHGYVVFSPDYSLAPRAKWPVPLQDLQTLLRFIRAHADDYGIDPDRIAAWGVSAGGHLATMLALVDDPLATDPRHGRVVGTVDNYGEADLTLVGTLHPNEDQVLTDFLGAPRAELTEEQLRSASLTTYARPDASVLIIHGTADPVVDIAQSQSLDRALTAAGADVSFVIIPGGAHDATTHRAPAAWDAALAFFAKHLGTQ